MGKVIGLKGHKNCLCDENILTDVANNNPGATWVFGDNIGFDQQVLDYAVSHNIPYTVIASQRSLGTEQASLVRNKAIVDASDEMVICYDGRTGGEVWFTKIYKENTKKPMTVLKIKKVNSGNWLPKSMNWMELP